MKLVPKSDKPVRESGGSWVIARLLPPKERARRAPAPGHEIGSRFEQIAEGVERAGMLADEIRELSRIIDDLRAPISEEYEERRRHHAEFMALKTAFETLQTRAQALEVKNGELVRSLSTAETQAAEQSAAREDAESALERAETLTAQLRVERDETKSRIEPAEAALAAATARVASLEHDLETQSAELEQTATRRREAEASAARAAQDLALAQQAIAVLERRIERSAAEMARLQTDLSKSEDRVAGNAQKMAAIEAELTQARREAAQFAQMMESRLETSRADLSALEMQLEAARARADKLEELNIELNHRVSDAGLREDALAREAADLRTQLTRALDDGRAAQSENVILKRELSVLEAARTAAVGHAEDVSKVAQGRETAIKRAEQKIAAMKLKMETAQTEAGRRVAQLEERCAQLQAELDRERAERSLVEGALHGARQGRARALPESA